MLWQIGPYLRKYKYLVKEVYIDEMKYIVWVFEWQHLIFSAWKFLHGF